MKNDGSIRKKLLNTCDILMVSFGAMIGWGWVVSSGGWIQRAGAVGTAAAFLIGGLMIFFVGMTYAELTASMPKNGSVTVFCQTAFGSHGAFIGTWAVILSYIGVVCFEACSFPTILQYIFPDIRFGYLYTVAGFDVYLSWIIIGIAFSVFITYINIKGLKAAALLQNILTLMIALVGIVLIIASAMRGNASNLEEQVFVGNNIKEIVRNVISVSIVTPFFLFGFDVIPQVASEINVPLKKIASLLMFSILLAVSFYGLVVLAVGYGMSSEEIAASLRDRGMVTADAMAKLFHSEGMAKVLILGGLCGIVTSWNSFLIGGSRAISALSEAGRLPRLLSKKHAKYDTPYIAILFVGLLSILTLFGGRVMLLWVSNCGSFACCLVYCIVSIAFLKLRKTKPEMKRPFMVRHYRIVGGIAALLSGLMGILFLIPGTECTFSVYETGIVCVWGLLGFLVWLGSRRKSS